MRHANNSILVIALIASSGLACDSDKTVGLTDSGTPDAGCAECVAPVDSGTPDSGMEVDSGTPPDSGTELDSGPPDAGPEDSGPVDSGTVDSGPGDAGMNCQIPPEVYTCNVDGGGTCPGGICIANGWCVGQVIDAGWYANCGDGVCDGCETAATCPADCAPQPTLTGTKSYTDPKTISVWVHGFTDHSQADLATITYGAVVDCNDLGDALQTYEPGIPCAYDSDAGYYAPNQVVALEYYGGVAPSWMTPAQVAQVEQYPYTGGPTGLQRYGLILGMFIQWRLAVSHADYANISCHSMGCLLTRYVIENDIEQLASTQKIVRWDANAGVIAGAQFARLYDNPLVQMYANVLGLGTEDFALMNPAYVQEYAAAYDHQLWEANSPLYGGILMHEVGGTDPALPQALNQSLLDDSGENPGDNPNDGIMFTLDEYYHSQKPAGETVTPSGMLMPNTYSYSFIDHIDLPSDEGVHMLMAASLFNRRKVVVTLQSLVLNNDYETDSSTPLMTGPPPAEVVTQTTVDYNDYTMPTFGTTGTIHTTAIATARSSSMYQQAQFTTMMPNQVIFEAPVFDDQTDFDLNLTLTETDYYPRWSVKENPLGGVGVSTDKTIATYVGSVMLNSATNPQTIPFTSSAADVTLSVQVVDMY